MEINLSDYEWFDNGPDFIYARDKKGNEFALGNGGKLWGVPKGSIWPNFAYASLEEVEQYIERERHKGS